MDTHQLVETIIGLSVALLIFASLIGGVNTQLVGIDWGNNTTAGIIAPLIIVVFVIGILLSVLYMLKGKK
jgi:hypothetical protein